MMSYVVGHWEYHGPDDAMVKRPEMVYYGTFETREAASEFGASVFPLYFEVVPTDSVFVDIHPPDRALFK